MAAPARAAPVREAPAPVASFSAERAYADVNHLATAIGPRAAGTSGVARAADYVAAAFAQAGLVVERQPFTFPQRSAELVAVADASARGDAGSPVTAYPLAFSADGVVDARLVFGGLGRPEDLPRGGLGGWMALIERGAGITFKDKVAAAATAGAGAAIVYNNEPGPFFGTLQQPAAIPAVSISQEDGQRLRALVDAGATRTQLLVQSETRVATNVVATLRPIVAGPSMAILGAHMDSVSIGPGANDNASGTGVLLELARTLATTYQGPLALRFIAFDAEEVGLLGSRHYVTQLSDQERASIVAMLNLDMVGVGDVLQAGGDDRLFALAVAAAAPHGITLERMEELGLKRSDQASFVDAGVPALFLHRRDDPHYHTPADTPDRVRPGHLAEIAAVVLGVVDRLVQLPNH